MELLSLFTTPLVSVPGALDPALLAALRAHLLVRAALEPGLVRSNGGGGWHSPPDLLMQEELAGLGAALAAQAEAVLRQLAEAMGQAAPAVAGVQVQAWGMVLPVGAYAEPHDHPDAHLSMVLHVEDHVPGAGGELVLVDGRLARLALAGLDASQVEVPPKAGTARWFPSGLLHFVRPVRAGTRVSVAANVRFQLAG